MSTLKDVISMAGGAAKAAAVCDVSVRAVYKWLSAGALPRTEYTGETDYIGKLAKAAFQNGFSIDPDQIRAGMKEHRTASLQAA